MLAAWLAQHSGTCGTSYVVAGGGIWRDPRVRADFVEFAQQDIGGFKHFGWMGLGV